MRTILALVVVVLVLNSVSHVGGAYWSFYQFRDAAEEKARFGGLVPESTLHEQMMDKAGKMDLPIAWDQINVRREGEVTTIETSYEQTVEVLPRVPYTLHFQFTVEGVNLGAVPLAR